MQAEVIAIGDELTSGQRLDTNSQWLSERLGELGVTVRFHTTVADDLAANVRVFREAASRVDVVVCTGGLGPTADDLTREALAAASGRPLVQDDASLAHIERLFARRARPMPERNRVQALLPEGASAIPNPHGTAPGIDIDLPSPERRQARLFALPGVPAEMTEMWRASVAPAILAMQGGQRRVMVHKRIRCFGVGESDLEAMLPDLIRRGRQPQVGITVHQATITLRITCEGESAEECERIMLPTVKTIYDSLGPLVFGEDDDELQQAVGRLLEARRVTLATVEPTGQLAYWLSELESDWYLGGVAGCSAGATGISQETYDACLAQDPIDDGAALASAVAVHCRDRFGADYALSLCPFPTDDERDDARPLRVAGAIAGRDGAAPFYAPFSGHPEILRPRALKHALNVLRLALLEIPARSASEGSD